MPGTWALVALSIGALALAPLLALALQRRPALAAGLDSFVIVSVGGVVALHVVPHSAQVVGPLAFLAAVAGLLLPIALHRVDHALEPTGHAVARSVRNLIVYALLSFGLFVHALFDGAALTAHSDSLALGVLAHRLPAALALWVVVRPRVGTLRALLLMALYGGGTVGGALIGDALALSAGAAPLALLQAFVAGSILHVVVESPPLASTSSVSGRVAGLLGATLAVAALWVVSRDEPIAPLLLDAMIANALVVAPVMVASFFLVGLLSARYLDGAPPLRARGARLADALAGTIAGLSHPLCSCAVAPLYDQLDARGTPAPASRAFLVAAPELGVPAALLTARLFGAWFLLARVAVAAVLALIAGLAAPSLGATSPGMQPTPPAALPLAARLRHGLRHGLVDAVDHLGPWIATGVAVAAALATSMPPTLLAGLPTSLHPLIAAMIGFPLYLCATGTTPVALALLALGLSPGGALALLLVGPATSLATLTHLRERAGRRAAAVHGLAVFMGAVAIGNVVDVVAHALGMHVARSALAATGGAIEIASLLVLLALLLASLWRQGVRGAVVQVMSPQHRHAADHDHGPGCAHDHGPPVAPMVPLGRLAGALPAGALPAEPLAPGAARVRLSFDPRLPSSEEPPA